MGPELLGEHEALRPLYLLAEELRSSGLRVVMACEDKSMKTQMKLADALKARNDKIEYRVFLAINIISLLGLLTFATLTIVKVFQGHANTALGFSILTVFLWWVFRHVPWPVSAAEKRRREIKALMKDIHEELLRYR